MPKKSTKRLIGGASQPRVKNVLSRINSIDCLTLRRKKTRFKKKIIRTIIF